MPHTFSVDVDRAPIAPFNRGEDWLFERPMNRVMEIRPALRHDAGAPPEDTASAALRGDVVLPPGVGVAAPEGRCRASDV